METTTLRTRKSKKAIERERLERSHIKHALSYLPNEVEKVEKVMAVLDEKNESTQREIIAEIESRGGTWGWPQQSKEWDYVYDELSELKPDYLLNCKIAHMLISYRCQLERLVLDLRLRLKELGQE